MLAIFCCDMLYLCIVSVIRTLYRGYDFLCYLFISFLTSVKLMFKQLNLVYSHSKVSPTVMKKAVIKKKSKENHWSLALIKSMQNPDEILEEDDFIVVLYDKYPKARFHYLILPKRDINSISEVTKKDLTLLRYMEVVAQTYIRRHRGYEFKVGYHAIPHMQRLHLHVISTDFDSPCLKTQHHWNIFNTPYMILSKDACQKLQDYGSIKINKSKMKKYLNQDLKCHKCDFFPKTIIELKKHILRHIPNVLSI